MELETNNQNEVQGKEDNQFNKTERTLIRFKKSSKVICKVK